MVWQFWFALVSKPRKSIGLERRFDCQWPRDLLPCVSRPPAGRLLGRRHSWRRDGRCGSWEAPMTWRLESSSLEKNLVDRFEKISVCVTDTHFKLWHKMPFYLSSPWMSELYWILSKVSIQSAEHFTTKETKQRHRRPKWILLLPTMSSGESSLYCKHLNVQRSNSLIKT